MVSPSPILTSRHKVYAYSKIIIVNLKFPIAIKIGIIGLESLVIIHRCYQQPLFMYRIILSRNLIEYEYEYDRTYFNKKKTQSVRYNANDIYLE